MGRRLGNMLGSYEDFDSKCTGDNIGKLIKIRVGLDISKPLRRWVNLEVDDGVCKLRLDYEELPSSVFLVVGSPISQRVAPWPWKELLQNRAMVFGGPRPRTSITLTPKVSQLLILLVSQKRRLAGV